MRASPSPPAGASLARFGRTGRSPTGGSAVGEDSRARARLVDYVYRLVGKAALRYVLCRKLYRLLYGLGGIPDAVELLIARLQPVENRDRVRLAGFGDVDLLEPAGKGMILLEVFRVFLVGCRADAAYASGGERRLHEVGCVERSASGRSRAHYRVYLVDEQYHLLALDEFLEHALDAFLEVSAELGSRHERAHVKAEDLVVPEKRGNLSRRDSLSEPFGYGGLADARLADVYRVVLETAAQDLYRPVEFLLAPYEGLELSLAREGGQFDGIALKHALPGIFLPAGTLTGVVRLLVVRVARRIRRTQPVPRRRAVTALLGDAADGVKRSVRPLRAGLSRLSAGKGVVPPRSARVASAYPRVLGDPLVEGIGPRPLSLG